MLYIHIHEREPYSIVFLHILSRFIDFDFILNGTVSMPINACVFGLFVHRDSDRQFSALGEPVFPTRIKDRLDRATVYVAVREAWLFYLVYNWKAR